MSLGLIFVEYSHEHIFSSKKVKSPTSEKKQIKLSNPWSWQRDLVIAIVIALIIELQNQLSTRKNLFTPEKFCDNLVSLVEQAFKQAELKDRR